MFYYIENGSVGEYGQRNPQLTEATQLEVDAHLLTKAKNEKLGAIESAYKTEIEKDIVYMGANFQADESSQLALTKVLSAGSVPANFGWLDASNNFVTMTFAELVGLGFAMIERGNVAFRDKQTKKALVRVANSIAELKAIP